jgi:hypothetical protein
MNRRGFLKLLAGAAAASTTAYFLPPIGGWKSDVIAQPWPKPTLLEPMFLHGLRYYNVASTSGEYLGVQRRIWDDPRNLEIAMDKMGIVAHPFDHRAQSNALRRTLNHLNRHWTDIRNEYVRGLA